MSSDVARNPDVAFLARFIDSSVAGRAMGYRRDDLQQALQRLEQRSEAYRGALTIIADRVYPATYLGESKEGAKMYGGTDDASRFAREVLERHGH